MYFLKLSFIECLKRYQRIGKNVKHVCSRLGATRWEMLGRPFVDLQEKEVIAIILNWMMRHVKRNIT